MRKKRLKPAKPRNPVAKASKVNRPKVIPNKKKVSPPPKDIPSTGNYNYNSTNIFGGE